MNSEINPEKLFNDYKKGILKKDSLIEILISSAISKIDPYISEQCIMILGNFREKEGKIFKFLEMCLISDTRPLIRAAAVRIIFQNYLYKGIEALKWVIKNDNSDLVMKKIIQMIKKYQNERTVDLNKSILERFSEIFKVNFEEAKFFRDLFLFTLGINISIKGNYSYDYKLRYGDSRKDPYHYPNFVAVKRNHVYALRLSGFELDIIPESIGCLKHLKCLTLNSNNLQDLPKTIRNLKELRYLSMIHNKIKKLPSSIYFLKKLKYLNLEGNLIHCLPRWIGHLYRLKHINLLHNNIENIPRSLYELVKRKQSKKYIKLGVNIKEALVLGLLEILGGWKLRKITQHKYRFLLRKHMLLHEANYYILDGNGHITKIFLYSRSPILSIIPNNINNLKYLEELHLYNNDIKTLPLTIQDLQNLKVLNLIKSNIKSIPYFLTTFVNSLNEFSY